MGRLIGMFGAVITYFCIATVMAIAAGFGYAAATGAIGATQWEQMLAILHGVDLTAAAKEANANDAKNRPEQPSLESIAEVRAVKSRELEMREKILQDTLSELRKLQLALEAEKDRYEHFANSFQVTIKELEAKEVDAGLKQFQVLVESMKPKQAKEQLLLKYKDNKAELVVEVLRTIEEARRAKIIAEFKTPEDAQVLAEILTKIQRSRKLDLIQDSKPALDRNKGP